MRMLTPADGQKFCCGILLQFDPDDSRMLDRPSGLVCGLALALLTGCFRCYVYINRKGGRVSLFRCLQMRSMLTSQGCWLAFITGCRQYVGRWCTKGAQHWMWCDGGGLPCSTSQHSPCRHCCYENLCQKSEQRKYLPPWLNSKTLNTGSETPCWPVVGSTSFRHARIFHCHQDFSISSSPQYNTILYMKQQLNFPSQTAWIEFKVKLLLSHVRCGSDIPKT